jgi:acyl carrier protein
MTEGDDSMDRTQIENILRGIIAERVPGVDPGTLEREEDLENLGADSLAFSWILADIEDAFEFVMRGADIQNLRTLAGAVAYVQKRQAPSQ